MSGTYLYSDSNNIIRENHLWDKWRKVSNDWIFYYNKDIISFIYCLVLCVMFLSFINK